MVLRIATSLTSVLAVLPSAIETKQNRTIPAYIVTLRALCFTATAGRLRKDGYTVGDELAFSVGWGRGHWEIIPIERVTPSGRMICGRFTVNPNLTIRGRRSGAGGPWRAEPVTPEIREQCRRYGLLTFLASFNFSELSTDHLDRIRSEIKSV